MSAEARRAAALQWHEANGARLDAALQESDSIESGSAKDVTLQLPANASPERAALVAEAAAMLDELEGIRSEHAEVEERRAAIARWHQRNAVRIDAQRELWRRLAGETVLPEIRAPVHVIPAGASARQREFLENENALNAELRALKGTLAESDSEGRRATIAQWHERNKALIEAQQQTASEHVDP